MIALSNPRFWRIGALGLALAGAAYAQSQSNDAAAVSEQMASAQKRLQQQSDGTYTLGDIRIDAAKREVRLPCKVLHRELPIEYLLVHETGKDHETVLTTAVSPLDLQVALLLANYTPGSTGLFAKLPKGEPRPFPETAPKTPEGHRVQLHVEWQAERETKSAPLVQWYQNSDTRQPPPDLDAWLFTGSQIKEGGFVAESEGSFVAVYADANALFNTPVSGNHRDDIWISLPKNIPPEETLVTLVISPAK